MTRELWNYNSGYESPYFEDYDSSGDSYGLAWRYLGVFIDDDGYSRKVLWAAYYDAGYSGNQIGEYQYYDWQKDKWDNSTCVSGSRCRKMDCHETSSSTWTLVGVYKDSLEFDGDTFFEQLFKHQGYCVWSSSSDYSFMQTMRETLGAGSCQYVKYGVYIGAKPASGGDISLAVYRDKYCKKERSSKYSVSNYLSTSSGSSFDSSMQKWNSLMGAYKTCQPCRAYSKSYNTQSSWRRQRDLIEYNDGEGDAEQNGFNCYDAAGYRNCNQCYKFDTHTDMEEASSSDLKYASQQGTILSITMNGVTYGSSYDTYYAYQASSMAVGLAVVVVAAIVARYKCKRRVNIPGGDGQLPLDPPVNNNNMEA